MALNPSTVLSGKTRPFKHLQGVHIKRTHMTETQACRPLVGGWAWCKMVLGFLLTFFVYIVHVCVSLVGINLLYTSGAFCYGLCKNVNHPEYTVACFPSEQHTKMCHVPCCLWGICYGSLSVRRTWFGIDI